MAAQSRLHIKLTHDLVLRKIRPSESPVYNNTLRGVWEVNESLIAKIARALLADYDAHRPGQIFGDPAFTVTLAEAFELQRQVAALRAARGEAVAGYKIGCISAAVQRQLGLDRPAFGHVFATELYPSGTVVDAAAFDGFAIEGEFAVRLGEDLKIAFVFPVIELHNNVFRGPAPTSQELIANNALHAGVVLPPLEIPCPEPAELTGATIAVYRNGELLGSANADAIPGGPLASLVKVSEHIASTGGALQPGQIVLTGSPLPLYPVRPGDHIMVRGPQSTAVELFARA
jgi:2-keto-4-pentenoate hydratase